MRLLPLLGITFFFHCAASRAEPIDALIGAIRTKDAVAAEKLLTKNPELASAKDGKGRSVVLLALLAVRGDGFTPPAKNAVLQSLLKRSPSLDFFEACGVGDSAHVRAALDREPSLATKWHSTGWSALHFAAFSGDAATTQLLLDHGAPIDVRARTKFLNTPLQVALLPGQAETARLLLERHADPLVRQSGGFAPIHEAALQGRRDLVDLLIEKGADINARANDGRNAVSEALRGGHNELAAFLRSRGAVDAMITADLTKSPE